MTILPKEPLAGGIPIYISMQDRIFVELHKKTMVSGGCALSLAWGTLWTEPVTGLNETSPGAASKGNRALRRVEVFGLVAWQYCRVCRTGDTDG